MRLRCGRCRRVVSEDVVDDHARNCHFVEPVEIDFEPIPDGVGGSP